MGSEGGGGGSQWSRTIQTRKKRTITTKRVTRKKRVRRKEKERKERYREKWTDACPLCVCVCRQRDRNRDRVAGSTLDYLRC